MAEPVESPSVTPSCEPVRAPLSLNQKIALLSMVRKGPEALVYVEIKDRAGIPKAFMSDYQALAGMGLATRPSRYHELTVEGLSRAREIAKELAAEHGIHVFYHDPLVRYAASVRCTCGYSRTFGHPVGQRERRLIEDKHVLGSEALKGLLHAMTPAKWEKA